MRTRGWRYGAVVLAAASSLALATATPSRADDTERARALIVRVGKLHVGDGTVLENAYIHMDGGEIVAVGTGEPPPGIGVLRFPNGVASPGFVDVATRAALDGEAVEAAEALTPGVRAADAFDPDDRALERAERGLTTTIGLMPGPSNVAAGRAAAASIGDARTVLRREGPHVFSFRAPALSTGRVPGTLAGARAMLGAAFDGRTWRTPSEADPPVRESALTELGALRDGQALAYVDGLDSARVAKEVLAGRGLQPTLVGLRSAWDETTAVAELGLPCVITGLGASDSAGLLAMPGRLQAAGIAVALSTGAPDRDLGALRMALALAVANGLDEDAAVSTVTHTAAQTLGVDDRVGRIAAGLRADLAVFSGEPWELRSRVLLRIAGGKRVGEEVR